MKVVGYVRVSTKEQAKDGSSLPAQITKIELYSRLHDLDLVEIISDPGESAKSLDRPGLSRALPMLASGDVEGIVISALDRLTRDLADWSWLIKNHFHDRSGQSLMSVSDSIDTRRAAGRMVLNILMTIAQWQREYIVEQTVSVLQDMKAKGKRTGSVPVGKRLIEDGYLSKSGGLTTLASDEQEEIAVQLIASLKGKSHRAIALELDLRGVPTRSGKPWCHTTVAKILKRVG